ncbi:MAG TPA: FGGY-family carbohydrate kinase, partial [Thermoleophilaceae bacterium]|nr:FGGY-family carbohydrate kinase [Thermoleophilaceae bacterium]
VYFVPALTGLGSPHWDPYARGTIVGLTRGAGRAHLARATLEAIAYQSLDAIEAQNTALGVRPDELRADGGATANGWLMQFQADLLGVPVVVPEVNETTVLGAAFLAGVATGLWSEAEVRETWREDRRFEPRMAASERDELVAEWRRALEVSLLLRRLGLGLPFQVGALDLRRLALDVPLTHEPEGEQRRGGRADAAEHK